MRAVLLAGMTLAMAGAAWAQAPQQPSDVLLALGGYCWRADLGEGATDTHCFSVARGGKLVMDVHKVRTRSGGVVYEGVTTYRPDASGLVRYDYANSDGDLLIGYAKREGTVIRFSKAPGEAAETVWYLGTDAYEAGGADAAGAKRKFVKAGTAGDGGL